MSTMTFEEKTYGGYYAPLISAAYNIFERETLGDPRYRGQRLSDEDALREVRGLMRRYLEHRYRSSGAPKVTDREVDTALRVLLPASGVGMDRQYIRDWVKGNIDTGSAGKVSVPSPSGGSDARTFASLPVTTDSTAISHPYKSDAYEHLRGILYGGRLPEDVGRPVGAAIIMGAMDVVPDRSGAAASDWRPRADVAGEILGMLRELGRPPTTIHEALKRGYIDPVTWGEALRGTKEGKARKQKEILSEIQNRHNMLLRSLLSAYGQDVGASALVEKGRQDVEGKRIEGEYGLRQAETKERAEDKRLERAREEWLAQAAREMILRLFGETVSRRGQLADQIELERFLRGAGLDGGGNRGGDVRDKRLMEKIVSLARDFRVGAGDENREILAELFGTISSSGVDPMEAIASFARATTYGRGSGDPNAVYAMLLREWDRYLGVPRR